MKYFFYCFLFLFINCQGSPFYVTCEPHFTGTIGVQENVKARFGNQLLAYLKAQWISEKYGFPYLHQTLDNDHVLQIAYQHKSYQKFIEQNPNAEEVLIRNFDEIKNHLQRREDIPVIFVINFSSYDPLGDAYNLHNWDEMRKNKAFLEKMRFLLSPVEKLDLVDIPENCISVAVHVRKGGGFDLPLWSLQYFDDEVLRIESMEEYDYSSIHDFYQDHLRPLKSPPEQYYVDQINKILARYPGKELYVHIFTDDSDPMGIIKRMKTKIHENERITFSARCENNSHDANVVEDLLSQMKFNILIRTSSSYSEFSHLFGDHDLVIYPTSYLWVGRCLTYPDITYEYTKKVN